MIPYVPPLDLLQYEKIEWVGIRAICVATTLFISKRLLIKIAAMAF